ncbi:MAG: VWA domain-containing protein [Clostridia bacterium]|nr:VWA domain-containing protein [Clostridia bacterium]
MKSKKIIIAIVAVIALICIIGGAFGVRWLIVKFGQKTGLLKKDGLIDDWEYAQRGDYYDAIYEASSAINSSVSSDVSYATKSSNKLGLSVGGSKNINNFRENIKNGYLPISTDITYNGLFYDYYFNTGKTKPSDDLFSPTYSTAVSKDPISGAYEYYMTVGLNSNLKESDFQRKKLNLVVVMDISGSMSSSFNSYYYDRKNLDEEENRDNRSKMKIANESLNMLIDKLNPDDKLGIVLFDNQSYLAKPVNLVGETDLDKLKEHILEISPKGGTNFEAGYKEGTELFTKEMLDNDEYENRIIVITDAMPNLGTTSRGELTKYVKENAEKSIYTSFIGVGVDFNTEVIECLSDVKGANYYSVHNTDEFKKIMSDDFEYMVTPLVFDLELKFESTNFIVKNVYGTDTKDKNSGTLIKVNTLFPSSSNSSGEAKGGVILLKIAPAIIDYISQPTFEGTKISVSYKDRDGKEHKNEQSISFDDKTEERYDNTGIRKAIALTRYANLMKNWILFEKSHKDYFVVYEDTGIKDCPYTTNEDIRRILGENERTSTKLTVSKEYAETFTKFKEYMKNEIKEIDDNDMNQEIEILDLLLK